MRSRHLSAVLLLLFFWSGLRPAGAGQGWHEAALASFDETWQVINDTYPDPSFGGLDWPAVRDELRPEAEKADSPEGVRRVIRQMLTRLGQSHFVLLSPSGTRMRGEAGLGIDVRLSASDVVIVRVTAGSSAASAGLRPGDVIRRVGDEPAAAWFTETADVDERVRAADVLERAAIALSGEPGTDVTLVVDDGERERSVTVTREREQGQVVRFGNLPPLAVRVEASERVTANRHRVGVIAFNVWMTAATNGIDTAVDRFRDADGLVLDLRGNRGGLVEMIRGVAGHVIGDPIPLGRMQTRQAMLPLAVNPRLSTPDGRSVEAFSGPVAILVDELTASASECFAGSLQSLGRARVFGRQTMGQALPAATRRLPSGDVLMHVIGDFVTPSGVRLEGEGVVPDQPVALSVQSLREGRDATLEAALAWVDTWLAGRARRGLP